MSTVSKPGKGAPNSTSPAGFCSKLVSTSGYFGASGLMGIKE
jgi:hypothetical protein